MAFANIDKDKFKLNLPYCSLNENDDVNVMTNKVTDALYECVTRSEVRGRGGVSDDGLGRWQRMLSDRDDARVWKAVNWKGDVDVMNDGDENLPSDTESKDYFEELFNPDDMDGIADVTTGLTIPVLDEPITPLEVELQIRKMKPNKACGPDGLASGISLLPAQWILNLTTLFNCVFFSGHYPTAWTRAKLFTIFKKGDRLNPSNYRGISVANSLSKLYDMILGQRLYQWFSPLREQAGAQKGRGCLEQAVTLRLLTNTAKRKKFKLFVVFIDFSKASDLVPCQRLFQV